MERHQELLPIPSDRPYVLQGHKHLPTAAKVIQEKTEKKKKVKRILHYKKLKDSHSYEKQE